MKLISIINILFYVLFLPLYSLAYIPTSSMILSRLNKSKGLGKYKISQKVFLSEASQISKSVQFDEIWWMGPKRLYVQITSPSDSKLKVNFSYFLSSKSWINSKDKRITQSKPYIESWFTLENIYPYWMRSTKKVKLGRAQGVVNYVFSSKSGNQIFWIEQDEFVIRQIKMDKNSFVFAEQYHNYPRGFLFPKKRKFISPEYEVSIEVVGIELIKKNAVKKLERNHWGSLDDMEWIKKFYHNIR